MEYWVILFGISMAWNDATDIDNIIYVKLCVHIHFNENRQRCTQPFTMQGIISITTAVDMEFT